MAAPSAPEPEKPSRPGAGGRLRTYFLAGILATAPVCLTIYMSLIFTTWVDDAVVALGPPQYNPDT